MPGISLKNISTFKVDNAAGDGNCAYNAFAKGCLGQAAVLEEVEQLCLADGQNPNVKFSAFIKAASKALHVSANWDAVKRAMLRKHKTKPRAFQEALAPVLRALSIDLASHNPNHYQGTVQPLIGALFNHILRKRGRVIARNNDDDIYSRHAFITAKFEEMCADMPQKMTTAQLDNYTTQKQIDLMMWWEQAGYQKFLKQMRKKGVWAGDLELSQLARYFGVNLYVKKRNMIVPFSFDYGKLPMQDEQGNRLFSKEQTRQLACRGIVGSDTGDELEISLTLEECQIRLKRIPEYDIVHRYILANQANLRGHNGINDLGLSADCIAQLQARSVIVTDTNCKYKMANLSAIDVLNLLDKKMPEYRKVRAYLRAHKDNLSGDYGINGLKLPQAVIDSLLAKKAIVKVNTPRYLMDLSAEEALPRIDAVPDSKTVLHYVTHVFKQLPDVLLANEYGCHWNNMTSVMAKAYKKALKLADSYLDEIQVKLDEWNRTQHKDWKTCVKAVDENLEKKTAAVLHQPTVAYSVPGKKTTLTVTRAKQVELDRELAMRLQQEEYDRYRKNKRKR